MPRADASAGEEKFATVSFWSDADDSITVSSPSTHELHGFYIQEPSNVASVDQSNQQYSILALSDSSGNVSERYAYTAYGQPTFLNASAAVQTSSAAGNRYTYTAREWDATLGLYHFRARWMSGLTGRFLTRDPIGYEDTENMYAGFRGNPMLFLDFTGLLSLDPKEIADIKGCKCDSSSTLTPVEGTQAWVECDDKGGFLPVAGPLKDIPRSDCYSKCGADACPKEHEEHHIEQFKEICPQACTSMCGEKRAGWKMGLDKSNGCERKIECPANKVGRKEFPVIK